MSLEGTARPYNRFHIRILFIILALAIPSFMFAGLLNIYLGADLHDYVPTNRDGIDYWHEILTFSEHGFSGGQYSVNDVPAKASFTHFGAHGPIVPMIYGTFAYMAGWEYYTMPILNLVFITIAIGVFIFWVRPDIVQSALLCLMILIYWPIHILIPFSCPESLYQSMAIVMAAAFHHHFNVREKATYRYKVLFFLLVGLASLARPLWSFLFLPYFLLCIKDHNIKSVSKSLLWSGLLVAAFFAIYQFLTAPYPYVFYSRLLNPPEGSPWESLDKTEMLIWHLRVNINRLAGLDSQDNTLEVMMRYQTIVIVIYFITLTIIGTYGRFKKFTEAVHGKSERIEAAFHISNIGILMVFIVLIYEMNGITDFRLYAPPLLLSLLLLLTQRRYLFLGVLLISLILLTPAFGTMYKKLNSEKFTYDKRMISNFTNDIASHLHYMNHHNRWCNTILIKNDNYKPYLVGLPPGIGFSFTNNWENANFKSKYILMEEVEFASSSIHGKAKLFRSSIFGNLYLNNTTRCD